MDNKKVLLSELSTKLLLVEIYTYTLISSSQVLFDWTSITCPRKQEAKSGLHIHALHILCLTYV